jgi:K+-sensing histidine kinase KdpD
MMDAPTPPDRPDRPPPPERAGQPIRKLLRSSHRRRLAGYLLGTVGILVVAGGLLPWREGLSQLNTAFGFLALVVVTCAVGGLGAGVVASFVAFLSFNFLFIRPYYTFAIGRHEDVVVLFVFLGLSILISVLMARATDRAMAAEAREVELRTLQELSRALVERGPDTESYAAIVRLVVAWFGFRDGALFIQAQGEGRGLDELVTVNAERGDVPVTSDAPGVERLVLNIGNRNLGVLVLRGERDDLAIQERHVLRAFSDQLALVLERDRVMRVAVSASRGVPIDGAAAGPETGGS